MIKKLLENIKDSFKKYIMNHIGTNIVLLLISFVILVIDFDDFSEFIQRLVITLFLTAMFTLLGEVITKDKKIRYLIYGVGLVISIITSRCVLEEELVRYLLGIVFSVGFGILYFMAKNSKQSSNKYLTSTVTNLFKLGIVGSVLNMGIMSILGLITTLLFELDEVVFVKTEIILLVLYYIPALIISLEVEEKENKFIYSVVNYVALPLISIATIVIYLYIFKLLFTRELPYTQTFGINAALLFCGIPIVLMVLSYENYEIMTKIASILKYLFIPLVFLQIFSLSLRINDYSFTSSRYFGIILILLGVISLVLLNKNGGRNFKFLLLPCIVISLIACMLPYINIVDFPNYMQIHRLQSILPEGREFSSLTDDERKSVISIYYYVHDEKYYPKYLSRDVLRKNINDYPDKDSNSYIYYHSGNDRVDISNYKEMEEYSMYSNDGFVIRVLNIDYDFGDYLEKIHSYSLENEDIDDYIKENHIININDKIDFYLTDLQFNYLDNYVTMDGYLLYK